MRPAAPPACFVDVGTNHVQRARTIGLARAHGLCYTRDMTIKRLDHVSVVVDDLAAAIAFFTALAQGGLRLDSPI